mmetsp:Transcript_19688/g.35129  ORF Transcript_19688/g.35129 Transcript_19688/m.35129 type:complete len:141 (-) Transcript_19688:59-481(-)
MLCLDITIDGNSLKDYLNGSQLCPERDQCNIVYDTGTSVLTCPSERYNALVDMIVAQKQPGEMCYVVQSHGDKKKYTHCIDSTGYLERIQQSDQYRLRIAPVDITNEEGPLYIFGIPGMEQLMTVYDFHNSRVGLAKYKN